MQAESKSQHSEPAEEAVSIEEQQRRLLDFMRILIRIDQRNKRQVARPSVASPDDFWMDPE